MLAHILRENYAKCNQKRIDLATMLSDGDQYMNCATLLDDPYALYNVSQKIFDRMQDLDKESITYARLLRILDDLGEADWELLFMLNRELQKYGFLEKAFTSSDSRYLVLRFLDCKATDTRVTHFWDQLASTDIPKHQHALYRYMLGRGISFFGSLLGRMDAMARRFRAGDTSYPYESYHAFLIQALICSRPAEGYADADIDTLRSRYLELENRVLANHSTLNRFVLLPYASSSTISVHDRFATLLVSEFMRSAMPAMAMHGHIYTYICLLRSVFRLRTDLMNRRRCSTGCVGDAELRHCLLDREPSRIRWLDGIVPRHARMHVLLRKAVMPEFCICLLIRKQPTLNIPIFLGYDQAGIPCILTPSTNKVTGLIKKLYGIDDYDRLVPLNVEDSILMTPESSSFPEMFGAWLKKQVNILIAYCGRTDIVPYIKELPERLEDGEQYKNGDGISLDSLFHKFYVY